MTKRRNPFDECHVQRKMHIGIKEVNLGVNCEENMKKVYGLYYISQKIDSCTVNVCGSHVFLFNCATFLH